MGMAAILGHVTYIPQTIFDSITNRGFMYNLASTGPVASEKMFENVDRHFGCGGVGYGDENCFLNCPAEPRYRLSSDLHRKSRDKVGHISLKKYGKSRNFNHAK